MQKLILKILLSMAVVLSIGILNLNLSLAQNAVGAVRGMVVDSQGAIIAGATVEIIKNDTKEKRTTSTDDLGNYFIPNLDVGNYTITVFYPSFTTGKINDVQVSISATTDLANLELKLNIEEEVIEINGSRNTNRGEPPRTDIRNFLITELPLLSRDPTALILLAPGVSLSTSSNFSNFSVSGSRERSNNFLVDNVDSNDANTGGLFLPITIPNIDTIQEFVVLTSNFSAEYGRNSGGIINFATKSGTNEFHGGVYEYNRSNAFSARNLFDTTGNSDPLHRNQFGFTLGGPIKKEKAFFFSNFGRDLFNVGLGVIRIVPTQLARQGKIGDLDLLGTNNANGLPLNPTVRELLNIYPMPDGVTSGPLPGSFEGFRFVFTQRNRNTEFTERITYQINEKHRLSGLYRFNQTRTNGALPETFPGFGDNVNSLQRASLFSFIVNSTLNERLVNEFRLGFNRFNAKFSGPGDDGVSLTLFNKIKAAFEIGKQSGVIETDIDSINGKTINLFIPGISSLTSFDTRFSITGTTSISDTVTYARGNHTIKSGFETRFVYSNGATNFGRSQSIFFDFPTAFNAVILKDSNNSAIIPSPLSQGGLVSDYASFLYGLVSVRNQRFFFSKDGTRIDSNYRGFREREFDAFLQDTWRIKPNFSLTYGIRYEFKGVPYEVNGLISTLIDQDLSFVTPSGGFVFQPVGKNSANKNLKLYDNDLNNFAPRLNFAWQPFNDGKTTIRGGYGLFYDRVFGNLFTSARGNPPFELLVNNVSRININGASSLDNLGSIRGLRNTATIFDGQLISFNIFPVAGKQGNNLFQKEFRTPYVQQVNFGLQYQFSPEFTLEADYIGGKGTKLLRVIDANLTSVIRKQSSSQLTAETSPISNFQNGSFNTASFRSTLNLSVAFSTYHAFTFRVTKSFSNTPYGSGRVEGAYTYSHSIDNAEDPLIPSVGGFSLPRDSSGFSGGFNTLERGESGFDVRHRLATNFIYDLPLKFDNKLLKTFFSDITMSGIIQAQSGSPYSVFTSSDTAGTSVQARADFASNGSGLEVPQNLNPRTQTGPSRGLFKDPAKGAIGNVPRSAFVGPAFFAVDYSIIKRFRLSEKHKMQLRVDFFNLFNRVNFNQPINNVTDQRFGQSVSTKDPRIIQFVFRYDF